MKNKENNKKEIAEHCDHCGIYIEEHYDEVRIGGKVFCSEWCADLDKEGHIFNNQNV
ncbi:MAG: hypothetical protein ACOCTT_02190 [archaeon]